MLGGAFDLLFLGDDAEAEVGVLFDRLGVFGIDLKTLAVGGSWSAP